MKNRAKCKLCNAIIESFHSEDYVECSCGHIAVDGGDAMRCYAKDFNNFLRIDDEGNEIVVTIKQDDNVNPLDIAVKPTKKELSDMFKSFLESYENLPEHAKSQPITHYDFISLLLLLSSNFGCDDCSP